MKADHHSHNLKLAHSWIMVLATPRKIMPSTTVHEHYNYHHGTIPHPHPNHSNSPSQLLEPVSPFQEFTGYRLHNCNNKQQQNRRCIAGDQLASLKAKSLLLFHHGANDVHVAKAAAPMAAPTADRSRPVTSKHEHHHKHQNQVRHRHKPEHAGGIPLEIVTITDNLHGVPGMIRIPQRDHPQDDDDGVCSEVTFEDFREQQQQREQQQEQLQQQLCQLDRFALNGNSGLFPPLSKHHTQHDATWGITTMRLEGEDDDDDGVGIDDDDDDDDDTGDDDDGAFSDIDWPSDEDKSGSGRGNLCAGATHALFRQNMNCSGLNFWARDDVHRQHLNHKTNPATNRTRTRTDTSMHAPVRLLATRDEENAHDRGDDSSRRDVLIEAWSSYDEFHLSRPSRSYASRAPSRGRSLRS